MNSKETANRPVNKPDDLESCVHSDKCGGCLYQGINYDEQLKLKEAKALASFSDKGVIVDSYLGMVGSPDILRYRNKMEYSFGDEEKGGELQLGMHMKGRYFSVISTENCLIVDEDFNRIQGAVLEFCRAKGYSFYHKRSHEGLLRHLVLRKGIRTKELLVNLVTTSGENYVSEVNFAFEDNFHQESFVQMLLDLKLNNQIVGILHTENNALADAVIPEKIKLLWGRDYYREEILGLTFKVGAFSFFQTNVEAAERLYEDALSLAEGIEGKLVFDLYSGTGTMTQALAKKAKKAIGVELVEEAVEMAKRSAEENGLTNCEFIQGDVLKVLDEIEEKPDIIVLDPPRAGVHPKAMNKILNYGVKEIIYVSCNPTTMAENLVIAKDYGYEVSTLKLYDNFPFTKHVEAIILLQRVER